MEAILHAEVLPRAEGEGAEPEAQEQIAGAPSAEQLEIINSRHSRVALEAGDLYAFPARVSSDDLDDYLTWFDPTSLTNFDRLVNSTGVPLLRQHSWMAGVDATFPLGRFFASELVPARAAAARRKVPFARDALGRAPEERRDLVQWAFIDRRGAVGTEPNAVAIRSLDAGVLRAVSIGATLSPIAAPGGDCISDIDGKSLLRLDENGSDYFPGVTYEVEGTQMIATARYVNAAQIEASLVTLGANPRAEVLRAGSTLHGLLLKARQLNGRGRFDALEVEEIEERYGGFLRDRRSFTMPSSLPVDPTPAPAPAPVAAPAPEPTRSAVDYRALLQTRVGEAVAAQLATYAVSADGEADAAVRLLLDRMDHVAAGATAARQASRDLTESVRAALGADEHVELSSLIAGLPGRLERAARARRELEDAYIRAYVRAHDVAETGFDRDGIKRRIAGWSDEDLITETTTLGRVVKTQFAPESKTRTVASRALPGAPAPAKTPGRSRVDDNPALYRS